MPWHLQVIYYFYSRGQWLDLLKYLLVTVDSRDGNRRVAAGRLRRRRREPDVVVRLQRRKEGRRAVRQQQLDEAD